MYLKLFKRFCICIVIFLFISWMSNQNALAKFKDVLKVKFTKNAPAHFKDTIKLIFTKPNNSEQIFKYGEVTTFKDVCIEYGVIRSKQIVVYNQSSNSSKVIRMRIRPRKRYHKRTWNLTLKATHIPTTHKILKSNAYFIAYSFFNNLGHFFFDSADNMYGTLKFAGDYRNETLQNQEFHLLAHTWDVLTKSHK